jgi:hypothetical protein
MSDTNEKQLQGSVSARDVLLRTSHEVRMISDTAGDLQNLIGNLVIAGAFGGSESIYELQSLDKLCQNLDAVAEFLHALSESASPDWKMDVTRAAKTVKLSDVSERLTGRKAETGSSTGEFDDFDSWPMTG